MTGTQVQNAVKHSIEVHRALLDDGYTLAQIAKAAQVITEAMKNGKKLILFGNGGSAADAQHIAGEFVGKFRMDREPLPAIALCENQSSLTAIGNDYGFDKVFARQLQAIANFGDVVIGISTSGNSENVVNALSELKNIGLTTIGLTGIFGGKLKDVVDIAICAPSRDTPRVQECHILIGHILAEIVEREMFSA